ncbi:ester cyclase [Intrasporangium flavum]|uniref:ester cyclase n=1 Tax=Intrasporangium flavum TaxID=1428657 RepID=UPI00096C0352|nr:ester cyclase [Intrasporangium flavum]
MGNADTMRRAYDLLNGGDVDGFGALVADGFVEHQETPGVPPTKAGVLDMFRSYLEIFPDLHMKVDEVLESGDRAVARVSVSGTQKGEFMGVPASGRHGETQLIDIMRFDADGRIAEHWGVMDMLTLMQQIGAIPGGPPEPAGAQHGKPAGTPGR